MDQLLELLQQIQELAGVGVDALQQAIDEGGGGGAPEDGGPAGEGAPAEGAPSEGGPPPEEPPAG